jgi:hypothetical protein
MYYMPKIGSQRRKSYNLYPNKHIQKICTGQEGRSLGARRRASKAAVEASLSTVHSQIIDRKMRSLVRHGGGEITAETLEI